MEKGELEYEERLEYERQEEMQYAYDEALRLEAEKQFEMDCATEEYLNEIPSTEEELFMQIQEDERNNSLDKIE